MIMVIVSLKNKILMCPSGIPQHYKIVDDSTIKPYIKLTSVALTSTENNNYHTRILIS